MKMHSHTHLDSKLPLTPTLKNPCTVLAWNLPLVASLILLTLAATGSAATSTFTGAGGDGNWSTAGNWSPVPSSGDDIIIADLTGQNNLVMDGAHGIGSLTLGDTGTRTTAFAISGNDNLTLASGLVANGNFSAVGLTFTAPVIIDAAQTWSISGTAGNVNTNAGIQVNNAVVGTQRTLTLNGTLTKDGTGQLGFTGLNIGNGNIQIDNGSLKLNAANGTRLTVAGTGTITVKNGTSLIFAQSTSPTTSTFTVSKAISLQDGSTLQVGGAAAFSSANSTITSAITLANNAHITLDALKTGGGVDTNFVFGSAWSGGTDSTLEKTGAATVTFTGASSNAFSTLLKISEGTLVLNSLTTDSGWRGPVEVASGAVLKTAAANQINNGASVTVNGQWDAGNVREIIGTLSGNGTVTNAGQNAGNALWISAATNSTFSGAVSGTALGSLTGATATQTFTGTVSVTNLIVHGTSSGGMKFSGNAIASATNVTGSNGLLTILDNAKLTVGAGGIAANGTGYVVLGGGTGIATLAASATNTSLGAIQLANGSGGSPVVDTSTHSMTLSGAISGTGGLTKMGAGTLILGGTNTYTGNTTVGAGQLTLATLSVLAFKIEGNGINNAVLGTGVAQFDGTFSFDLSSANTTSGNSWNIVDVGSLSETFGSSFLVNGFTENSNVWTYNNSGLTWTFTESTGILNVVPEPTTAGLLLCGATLFAALCMRRRS